MFQNFEKMSVHSRVWIYQTSRAMTAKEENMVAYDLKNFMDGWESHGIPLLGSAKVQDGRFVIIAVDETQKDASGCSIDTSTRWMKELGEKMGIDFFDRSLAYVKDKEIQTVAVFGLKQAVEQGNISPDTWVYNSSAVQTVSQLISQWKIPAAKSTFLARYFQKQVA